MGSQLHQALRTLCFNTEWKHAVFWKLKYQARMILTWEDAYYDNHEQHDPSESKCFSEVVGNLYDGDYSHEHLGLTLAKISYHVYSLGEGIVGQVALTGKHRWIFSDKHVATTYSSLDYCDGWKTQFSAGIKTVVVVAVSPLGVVQLGSLNKITEDMKLVIHIRETFFSYQDPSVWCIPSVKSSMKSSSCLSDAPTRSSGSGIVNDYICNLDKTAEEGKTNIWSLMFPSLGKLGDCSNFVPFPDGYPKRTVETINKHGVPELSTQGAREKLSQIKIRSFPYGATETTWDNQQRVFCIPEPFDMKIQKDSEMNIGFETEFSPIDELDVSLKFAAGCELYEAFGSAFQKQSTVCDWEVERTESETVTEMTGMGSSNLLMKNTGSEHLLEALVANFCCSGTDVKSEKSFSKSVQSLLTEKLPEPTGDKHTIGSASYSFTQSVEEDKLHCLNSSEACGLRTSKDFSSRSGITCIERLERPQEPAKINKKRARPGENCRPQPRDRQLIQDRIKELRELVPNGLKCNIDSLLECTIKHLLFLQSITRHANKLNKFTISKLHSKKTGIRELFSYEQGSSWAVEVGSHLKVCPVMVENINMDGQMLVEMLCEESSHFFEIAEAIRSMGLTILKGVMDACGDKTWICFVIEGQNNRTMHRIDILWSLLQILQPKITI